jgi:hypothetical protein
LLFPKLLMLILRTFLGKVATAKKANLYPKFSC